MAIWPADQVLTMLQKLAQILPFLLLLHPSQDCAPHGMVGFVAGWGADQVSALQQERAPRCPPSSLLCCCPPLTLPLHPSQDCAPHAMVGFVAGWRADQVSALPQEEVVSKYLEQLDRMFATPESSNPATAAFAASKVRVCMGCVRISCGAGVRVWGILSAT